MRYLFMKVEVFILTHKEINETYDDKLYKPLLTGAVFKENKYGFLTDDTGDNISNLNDYYGELSGEYWAWKNTMNDIIGFTHRRRWFVKNYKFDKITQEDIIDSLKTHDIILPPKFNRRKSLYEFQKEADIKLPDYDVEYEDYLRVENVLRKYYPDYGEAYNKTMNGNILYAKNMFICNRELADKYFEWLFDVLEKLMDEIDLKKYENRDKRIFGFISERLLTTFVLKNNLKVKEYDLYSNEAFIPYVVFIEHHCPLLREFIYKITPFMIKFFKKIGIYKS